MSFYSLVSPSITRNPILIRGFFYSGGDANMLENGYTPLEQVFLLFDFDVNFSFEAIKIILEFGGNPNVYGKQPPLISAVQFLDNDNVDKKMIYDIVNLFLSKNADPNVSWKGRTETKYPIMYAIDSKADDVVLLLLQNGANIDLQDSIYGTYLKRAEANELSKSLSFIKSKNENLVKKVDSITEKPKTSTDTNKKSITKEYNISNIVSTRASKICIEKVEIDCGVQELRNWFLSNCENWNWTSGDSLSDIGAFASGMASSVLGSYSSKSKSKVHGDNIVEIAVPGADLTIYFIEFKELKSNLTEVSIYFYYEDYNLPRPNESKCRAICRKLLEKIQDRGKKEKEEELKRQQKLETIVKRKAAFECVNCGKRLSFIERLLKRTTHKKCIDFRF